MTKFYMWCLTLLCCLIIINGCIDINDYDNIDVTNSQRIAIPLVNSDLSIKTVSDNFEETSTAININDQGEVTVFYQGEIVRNNSTVIFPPLPGLADFPLIDTNVFIPLPFDPKYRIDRATFGKTNMFFRFQHAEAGTYQVKMTLPQVTKDGVVWSADYEVVFDENTTEVNTRLIPLDGWGIIPIDNEVQFIYEAINESGERIVFDYAAMRVDQIDFFYLQGYFAEQTFPIEGNNIGIGIFENWVSGGLTFDDPKMNIIVNNAFGFPVRSNFKRLSLTTLSGSVFDVESEFIDKGIDFTFPTIDEIGVVKNNDFSFDKNNSNIAELFKDKIVNVSYDIEALVNPDKDNSITNFVDTSSFFSVDVAVEIPLLGRADRFTLQSLQEIDLSQLEDVKTAELKTITSNGFPAEMGIQIYFMADSTSIIDSLYTDGARLVEGAPLGDDLRAIGEVESTTFDAYPEERLARIKGAQYVRVLGYINNTDMTGEDLWIYDTYKIKVKIGAIIELQ